MAMAKHKPPYCKKHRDTLHKTPHSKKHRDMLHKTPYCKKHRHASHRGLYRVSVSPPTVIAKVPFGCFTLSKN